MELYLPFECAGCGQPSDDFYCYSCKCQECGCHLINEICKICTYDSENPIDFSTPYSFNESPNFSYHPTHSQPILCEFYGINSRYGHYCTLQVLIISNPKPCYVQDYDEFPQTLPSFPQQYPCCEDYGGPHETFQCQPRNYYEPNPCYDSNYSGLDQIEPPKFPVIHQPPHEMSVRALQAREDLMKSIENFLKKFNRISFRETPKVLMQAWDKFLEIKHAQSEEVQELLNKLLQDLQSINEELAEFINTSSWNLPTSSYDDDDNEYSFATQEYLMTYSTAITPDSPKTDSLIMEDEHLDTIPDCCENCGGMYDSMIAAVCDVSSLVTTTSRQVVNLDSYTPDALHYIRKIPIYYEMTMTRKSEDECECDVPDCDDSQTKKNSTFSNPLFDDSTSSDDESSHEEVIYEIRFKTFSNPLFDLDEEIISSDFNPIHNEDLDFTLKNDRFDTESYLLESLLNRDTLMASSLKIDSLFDEFAGELITIPPRIVNREHEEYISLMERLLYDNSSPRPPEDFHVNQNTIIESLPTFPIPVEDSNSLREEIDIFSGPYDSIPPGIKSDNYDSEGDDNSTSLPEFESFHVGYPDSGDSTIDVVEDIPVDVPNILPTHLILHMDFDFIPSHNDLGSDLDVSSPSGDRNKIYDPGICIEVVSTRFLTTLSPVIDTLLPFSSKNEDKVFNHGVLASKEKSPPSSSHRGFKASKIFHHKISMLIYREDIPILDVPFLHFYPP
ncbi:hypothetical protein Tco_0724571 [Tanacetum coccineum]